MNKSIENYFKDFSKTIKEMEISVCNQEHNLISLRRKKEEAIVEPGFPDDDLFVKSISDEIKKEVEAILAKKETVERLKKEFRQMTIFFDA